MSRDRTGAGIPGRAILLLAVLVGAACGTDPAGPVPGETYEVVFRELTAVPADEGTLEVWVHGAGDTLSVGRVIQTTGALDPFRFRLPPEGAVDGVLVTVEPPGDADARPSSSVLLHGDFRGARAELSMEGVVTDGRPLQPAPGAHSLFTTSNNSEDGYPSAENAGLWLFTLTPSRNEHGTREVKLTPLRAGWTYEGWVVRTGSDPVWISYGKFRPDELSLLSSRDDSGTGPFSGAEDFRTAGVEDVPGEEWTTDRVARRLGITLPGDLELPLALDAVDGDGEAVWHHVISVEPSWQLAEGPVEGRPFPVRPYENAIGAGGPGLPRTLVLAHPPPTAGVGPVEGS